MQEYDTVLKALLRDHANSLLEQISGTQILRWLPVELPHVQNTRMDLLGEAGGGELIHIELQSTNEPQMALRMAEYALRVFRLHNRFPKQILLYVGEPTPTMPVSLTGSSFASHYQLIDIRQLDAEQLLKSEWLSDNVIGILGKLADRKASVRRVLRRIAQLSGEERGVAFQQLSILAGLRKLGEDIREEAKHMPVLSDIMDHDLIGPAIRQGIKEGIKEGRKEGLQQGLEQSHEALRKLVSRLIEKRFGPISTSTEAQFSSLTPAELEDLITRLVDARSVEELFAKPPL